MHISDFAWMFICSAIVLCTLFITLKDEPLTDPIAQQIQQCKSFGTAEDKERCLKFAEGQNKK